MGGNAFSEVAAPIQLSWDPAGDPSVRGYALYYGAVGQSPGTRLDVGTSLSGTISGLTVGATYWIYAVSYDTGGIESPPSNQLLFTAPAAPTGPKERELELVRQTDGSMSLNYQGQPGQVYGIQFTSQLNPPVWQTLTNVTANSLSNVIALDISARAVPQRFYRVAHAAQPLLSAITPKKLANGYLQLSWTAPPYSTNRVQFAASPNATFWPTFAIVVADAEGRAVATDPAAAIISQRFYRVMMP